MATETWFGGLGSYFNKNFWSPKGVPQQGDTAVIQAGEVKVSNATLQGVTIDLGGTTSDTAPVLALHDAVIDTDISLRTPDTVPSQLEYGEFIASGEVVNEGTITTGTRVYGASDLRINIADHSQFVNKGEIVGAPQSTVTIAADNRTGVFVNDGTVESSGGGLDVQAPVIGTGTFALGPGYFGSAGKVTFEASVAQGTTVQVDGSYGRVILMKAAQFDGAIKGLDIGMSNQILLPNLQVTALDFANNELELFRGNREVAELNVVGNYSSANFSLSSDAQNGTAITFLPHPTTPATMS